MIVRITNLNVKVFIMGLFWVFVDTKLGLSGAGFERHILIQIKSGYAG
jgi:hypothetical protein